MIMKRKIEEGNEVMTRNQQHDDGNWLPNTHIPETDAGEVQLPSLDFLRDDSIKSNLTQSFSSKLESMYPNDFIQMTMASFNNPFSQIGNKGGDFDMTMKSFSFESLPQLDPPPQIENNCEILKNEPSVVPVTAKEPQGEAVVKIQKQGMTLRPKRNTKYLKSDYSPLFDGDGTEKPQKEKTNNLMKKTKDLHSVPEVNKKNTGNISPVPPRKKRAYYRKNKHPKEVLQRVEAERLKRKRLKNRELAARSRKRKKEKMDLLETENAKLKRENSILKEKLARCVCHARS